MHENYFHHHRRLARTLPKQPTPAEQHLWHYLRKRQICGFRFRRQARIGRYITDFACFEAKLIIELDGEVHDTQQQYDQIRDEWLQCQGFKVLRFRNQQALEDTKSTLQKIQQTLTE